MSKEELLELSNNKYTITDELKINKNDVGKFATIFKLAKSSHIVKVQDKYIGLDELEVFLKLRKTENIVKMIDHYVGKEFLYIILEKGGCTLREFIIKNDMKKNRKLAIRFINDMFNSLRELNECGFIHCDIKLSNFIVFNSNKLKLIDFNKCQRIETPYKHNKNYTLSYIPPETILNNTMFNTSSDVWAVGVIIYRMMTGNLLFNINDNSTSSSTSSDSESNSTSSSNSEYYQQLLVLHCYKSLFGDNDYIVGDSVEDYYCNDNLIFGAVQENKISNFDLLDDVELNNILKLIFVYDINKRITPITYFSKYKLTT